MTGAGISFSPRHRKSAPQISILITQLPLLRAIVFLSIKDRFGLMLTESEIGQETPPPRTRAVFPLAPEDRDILVCERWSIVRTENA